MLIFIRLHIVIAQFLLIGGSFVEQQTDKNVDENNQETPYFLQVQSEDRMIIGGRPFVECDHQKPNECDPTLNQRCNNSEIICPSESLSHAPGCMALWKADLNTGRQTMTIVRGCWSHGEEQECHETDCISSKPDAYGHFFCCCKSNYCNRHPVIRWPSTTAKAELGTIENDTHLRTASTPSQFQISVSRNFFFRIVVLVLGLFAIIAVIACVVYRRMQATKTVKYKSNSHINGTMSLLHDCESVSPEGIAQPPCGTASPLRNIVNLQLAARGRYGIVYRGEMKEKTVAVKVFPSSEVESWVNEQEIYALPMIKSHSNILPYIGAEQRGTQFWLITEFQEIGSLYDHLKSNVLTQDQALRIMTSMLKGLSFLHEERISTNGANKPGVVHRDFKSRNVLLRNDFSACVGDFGLALKCENGRIASDSESCSKSQVGTRRYMAPEVLDGAMEFSAFAFRQIDVYAAALVIWEILSRTAFGSDDIPPVYRLPYEAEIGLQPEISQMQRLVCTQKQRPLIRSSLLQDLTSAQLCSTMCEMWDAEPEGRLTSRCAYERFRAFSVSTRTPSPRIL